MSTIFIDDPVEVLEAEVRSVCAGLGLPNPDRLADNVLAVWKGEAERGTVRSYPDGLSEALFRLGSTTILFRSRP